MSFLKFGKPKTPGYGLSRDFYLTVLAAQARLPSILATVNPKGEGGAVSGFGAPLSANATKADLERPLSRGMYAIASPDRTTVLRMMVVSRDEAGFDPELIARSRLAETLSPEALARIRATWTLLQFSFESHHPSVLPALRFLWDMARRLAELSDGVIADPMSERYLLPGEAPRCADDRRIDAAEHVSVRTERRDEGHYAFTLGMRKFALPEFELADIPETSLRRAGSFLLGLCQLRLSGARTEPGSRVGGKKAPFEVALGGLDRARWEGIACLELLPPTGVGVEAALLDWEEGTAR